MIILNTNYYMRSMITDTQLDSLVRLGMQHSSGWALRKITKIEYSEGVALKVTLSMRIIDETIKTVYIPASGEINIL